MVNAPAKPKSKPAPLDVSEKWSIANAESERVDSKIPGIAFRVQE